MRSEQQVLDLVLEVAKADERIRAVVMNGSRVNPNARTDPFQDFDIIYLVTEVAPFKRNLEWIQCFGELTILQTPEDMGDPPPSGDGGYGYLMQFTDGNRIDLGIYPLTLSDAVTRDSLSVVLLDKDGTIGSLPPPSERDYLPTPPTAKQFADCCNEFWWVCPYVAKGLWREQLTYARHMLDQVVRDELMKMLTWYVGLQTDFSRNLGGFGSNFDRYLEPELWQLLQQTYADASYANMWIALFATCDLFRRVATPTAKHFGFHYPYDDDGRVSAHLEHVKRLPKDASEIY